MTTRRFAWAVWGLTLALAVAWPFLSEAAKLDGDVWAYALFGLGVIGYATVGALITSRQPGNRIGLLLAGIGLAVALALAGGAHATLALDQGVDLPFQRAAAWMGQTGLALMLLPIPLIFSCSRPARCRARGGARCSGSCSPRLPASSSA